VNTTAEGKNRTRKKGTNLTLQKQPTRFGSRLQPSRGSVISLFVINYTLISRG